MKFNKTVKFTFIILILTLIFSCKDKKSGETAQTDSSAINENAEISEQSGKSEKTLFKEDTKQKEPSATTETDLQTTPVASVSQLQKPQKNSSEISQSDKKYSAIEDKIFSEDLDLKDEGLNELEELVNKGEGKDLLMKAWRSDDQDLLDAAETLITNFDEPDKMDFIMAGLENTVTEVRTDSLNILRGILNEDVNPPLLKALNDTDELVLEEVASLIYYFSDKDIYDTIPKALDNGFQDIRENAIQYLEDKQNEIAVRMLIDALNSKYEDVINACADSLRFITDAEIESSDYKVWKKWWDENGSQWVSENAKEDPEEK